MSGWVLVAIVAIVMSSLVKIFTGNRHHRHPLDDRREMIEDSQPPRLADDSEARREIQELRERIKVLERIVTDDRKSRDLSEEIERLR